MSRTEHRKGRLLKIENGGSTLEDICKTLYKQNTEEPLKSYYTNYTEYISEDDRYVIADGSVYEIIENNEIDENEDIAEATMLDNGEIEYEIRFYNGGAGFSEMVEKSIEKMNNQKRVKKLTERV